MKKMFFTLDLEEWYHLEYLKEHRNSIASQQSYIDEIIPFMENMIREGVKMTVFVVGDIAREKSRTIRKISEMGHEIACHGYTHSLLYNIDDGQFRKETLNAKRTIEDIIDKDVHGYRAACFSMDNAKLDILWECGFSYDASLIRFKEHKLYSVLDMSTFRKIDSLVYEKNGRIEFETPTLDVFNRSIPISGGGYFRMFPLFLTKSLMKKYLRKEDNFIFYIHPFELSVRPLAGIKRAGKKNWLRFQIGRNGNPEKLKKYISYLKSIGAEFECCGEYLRAIKKEECIL